MVSIICKVLFIFLLTDSFELLSATAKRRRFPTLKLREQLRLIAKNKQHPRQICYDLVGCFDVHPKSPLHRIPEDPHVLDTKFYLFRRNIDFSHPHILYYDDNGTSLYNSKFNFDQPTKVLIHGFMGRWNSEGGLNASYAYMKAYDYNVILMDWSTAARGPGYASAASNTEVVGRQLGLLLNEMINAGLNPSNVHLIGFSLGAHVAACASELLKSKNYLIGRITGLDASSPLFRHNHIREKTKKLDKEDAVFVDVLHTDASPVFVDGFGLWEPIGHVDFFANGGQEQPGCVDRHPSVVVTHFEKILSRETACSHIRAFELFIETIPNKANQKNKCEFLAYKCSGGFPSFENGLCFPELDKPNNPLAIDMKYRDDIGTIGENARGVGVMYFLTKSIPPYCGSPLQAHVRLSPKTASTLGILVLIFQIANYRTIFELHCEFLNTKTPSLDPGHNYRIIADKPNKSGTVTTHKLVCKLIDPITRSTSIYSLSTTDYNLLTPTMQKLPVVLKYYNFEIHSENSTKVFGNTVVIEDIRIKDVYGNSWQYNGKELNVTLSENEMDNHKVTLLKNENV